MTTRDVRGAVRQAVLSTHSGRKLAASNGRRKLKKLLLGTGLFDPDYYAAQRGLVFDSADAALEDYLEYGRRKEGAAPNLLLEPEWLRPRDWSAKTDPLQRYLREGAGENGVGPLFDEAAYLKVHKGARKHPGRALGHFLSTAGDDTPLPVPADRLAPVPTLGQIRALLTTRAQENARHRELRSDRRSDLWDEEAEAGFVARLTGGPALASGDAPLVTVVMPVRNRPVQVRAAVASIQAQTLAEWELVVVDDGSTDTTAEVIEGLAAQDGRIRLVRGAAAGVSAARNTGIEAARGQRLAFLDSDNTWVPHFLEVMVRYLDAQELRAGHAVIDTGRVAPLEDDEEDEPVAAGVLPPGRYLAFDGGLDHLLVKNHIDLNGLMADTAVVREIGGFDVGMRRWVDHDLAIRIAKLTPVPLVPFVGVRYDHAETSADRITLTESEHWQWVALGNAYLDWAALGAGLGERVAGRVSICMPTYQDWRMTQLAVDAVLRAAAIAADAGEPGADVEVVVVVNGSRRSVTSILGALYLGEDRVRIEPVPRNLNFAIGSNLAFGRSTGATAVFLNNDTEVSPGWLAPLLADLEDPDVLGVQPLLLYPDGTVQSAGSIFPGGPVPPSPLLVNHPPADAVRAAPIRLSVVTAAALGMRAADIVALRGFDPIYVNGFEDVDLCLRAVGSGPKRFSVVTDSIVFHHESRTPGRGTHVQPNRKIWQERWKDRLPGSDLGILERLGFEISHLDPGPPAESPDDVRIPRPVLTRPLRAVTSGPAQGKPSLRWAIKTAAHAGPKGDGWGDVHFADDLAVALRRLGQDVVVDRRDSNQRSSGYLDDVVLTLRGLDDVVRHPGRVNLMWVISHPELVTAAEAGRYDAVFAASPTWSAQVSKEWGIEVEPLLQATDPARFHPELAGTGPAEDVLFVGSSRNIERPIVRDAVAAGLDLAIYGNGWEQFGVGDRLRAQYLANDRLGAAYASAGVVLCDHWTDMAQHGLLSNRLFDAVASGARVVSDPVPGIEETFGGAVRTYTSVAELAELCGPDRDRQFPDTEARRAVAKQIGEEHSFDARAHRLLEAALAAREAGAWARPVLRG